MKILKESPFRRPPTSQIGMKFKCRSCKTKYQLESTDDYTSAKVYGDKQAMDYISPHYKFSATCPECGTRECWVKFI